MVQIACAMPAKAKSPSLIAAAVKLKLCPQFHVMFAMLCYVMFAMLFLGAAVAEWLSSWLAEQEDRGLIPGLVI